jgi:Holliday junction DNA helicase RuvB
MKNNQLKSQKQGDDPNLELLLRPSLFDEYIGQERVKNSLKIIIEAAKKRQEAMDHLLFYGQAGLGKTTLAYLVAREFGTNLKVTSGPAIEKAGDLAAILTNLEPKDILFIDEAHRLNRMIEEILYPAMESRKLNIVLGKGPAARTISLDLPPFTLIAATTRVNLLSSPLRSRFGASFRLDYYSSEEIRAIIRRSAKILGLAIEEPAVGVLSEASRFTPRVANRLLKRSRDFLEVSDKKILTEKEAGKILEILGIDKLGLESHDRKLLEIIIKQFKGGPAGLSALSASLNEEKGAIEEVYEPYLIKIGLIRRTPLGRVADISAYEHLNYNGLYSSEPGN